MNARETKQLQKMVTLLQSDGGQVPDHIRDLFVPPRPVNEMTDAEVNSLPGVKVIRNLVGLVEQDTGYLRGLFDATYQTNKTASLDKLVDSIFSDLPSSVVELVISPMTNFNSANPSDHKMLQLLNLLIAEEKLDGSVEKITIYRDKKPCYRYTKRDSSALESGARFKMADYATFIGQTFTKKVEQSKQASRNGTYELRVLPGDPSNHACHEIRLELHQTTDDGLKHPVVVFPPAKGEREDHRRGLHLQQDVDIVEVASISGMMKQSVLCIPQTPAVTFGLVESYMKQQAALPASNPWKV